MFKLEINTDGAAFRDEDGNLDKNGSEVCRLLKSIAEKINDGYTNVSLLDINGNKVGEWFYEE